MKKIKSIPFFWIIIFNMIAIQQISAIGTILGTVYYRGPKHGDIHIEAYDNSGFQGSPVYWVIPSDTGPYRLGNVDDGVYWIAGYMDADSNGVYNETVDPVHFRGDSVIVQGDTVEDIDLMLDYYPSLDNPPILLGFYAIRISPSIESVWPGTKNYLCYSQVYAYHKWGHEYIDSVYSKAPLITEWQGQMYDDGLHWDGTAGDSIFGRYETKDSTEIFIWLYVVDFWLLYSGVTYTPWPTGIEAVWARPALEGVLPNPILIDPINEDTVMTLQPDFSWHANGADWYEVIVWDTIPMPSTLGENIVWRTATASGDDTTLSMVGDTTQLQHGKIYYWAVIGYEDPPYGASAMEWSWFSVDTSLVGISEYDEALADNQNIVLLQNKPNPFTKNTKIAYSIQRGVSSVELKIYDATGRLIKLWDDKTIRLSNHVIWDGTDDEGNKVPAGIYFYKFEIPDYKHIKKLIILR